jgi:two-component system phosphate regulon response regulator PhoB
MAKALIQLVDHDQDILDLLQIHFVQEGYDVILAHSAEEAMGQLCSKTPDLILLDLMLPGLGGIEFIDRLTRVPETRNIPVVILCARSSQTDIINGLESGATDYITKPFSLRILQARVKAVLRRRCAENSATSQALQLHELSIDSRRHHVSVNGKDVELTRTEFAILLYLARTPGWVYTRSQILDAIHGTDHSATDRSVDVQILGLRRKLGRAGKYLETVRGV